MVNPSADTSWNSSATNPLLNIKNGEHKTLLFFVNFRIIQVNSLSEQNYEKQTPIFSNLHPGGDKFRSLEAEALLQ